MLKSWTATALSGRCCAAGSALQRGHVTAAAWQVSGSQVAKASVTATLRLRFDRRSTHVRLQFDGAAAILRYGLAVLSCCTAA